MDVGDLCHGWNENAARSLCRYFMVQTKPKLETQEWKIDGRRAKSDVRAEINLYLAGGIVRECKLGWSKCAA